MKPGIVDIWHGELSKSDQHNEDYYALLIKEEQRQADSLTRPQVRSRFVEVRARLRLMLADYLNQASGSILINRTEHGKPFLPKHPELFFNLSHSGKYVVLALTTEAQLGIDVEKIRNRQRFEGLVNKCFVQQEIQYWQALPEQDKSAEFYRFWTGKEAFVKAVGRGIGLGLNRVEIAPNHPSRLLRIPEQYGNPEQWTLVDLDIGKDLRAAVCIKTGQGLRQQIRYWP